MSEQGYRLDYSRNRNRKVETGKPGQPPKYESPGELEAEVDLYFAEIEKANKPPTIEGMSLFLGFANRSSIRNYEDRNDEYSRVIKRAISFIAMYREEQTLNPTVPIAGNLFWLKNHGWDAEQKQHVKFESYDIEIPEPGGTGAPNVGTGIDDDADPY